MRFVGDVPSAEVTRRGRRWIPAVVGVLALTIWKRWGSWMRMVRNE